MFNESTMQHILKCVTNDIYWTAQHFLWAAHFMHETKRYAPEHFPNADREANERSIRFHIQCMNHALDWQEVLSIYKAVRRKYAPKWGKAGYQMPAHWSVSLGAITILNICLKQYITSKWSEPYNEE